jgi:hypothetical protein
MNLERNRILGAVAVAVAWVMVFTGQAAAAPDQAVAREPGLS